MSGSAAQSLADKLAGLPITLKPSGEPPRCQGCDHPRPVVYTGGYTAKRSRLGTMLANAEDGKCDVCAILSQGIVKFLDSEGCPLKKEQVDSLLIDYNTAGSRRNIDVTFVQTSVKLSFFVPEITPWLAENMPDLSLGNHVPRATWSDESTAWAIRQLEHCRRTHESCNSFPPAPLPSRVLDVSVNDGTGVRLYVTQGETAPYAALSHCWGRRPFLRTMSGSLEDHRNEISWAQLPRTFREAVEFVRKLGIRYLWIDSLCIVQDDLEDWRREASRMASVYQNAAFVVSAAKAAGAYGGLYADLPPACRPLTVRYKPRRRQRQPQQGGGQQEEDSEEVVVHVRRALSHPYLTTTQYHPQISALRIFTRAWIMQERFLCPRILHFGPEELLFECFESTTCQCSIVPFHDRSQEQQQLQELQQLQRLQHNRWHKHMVDRVARPKHYYSLRHWQSWTGSSSSSSSSSSSDSMSTAELEACWRRLVEDYTRLRLSHDRDIFPAVSGLARQMLSVRRLRSRRQTDQTGRAADQTTNQSDPTDDDDDDDDATTNPRYVAGLWSDSLLRGDLAWAVLMPILPHRDESNSASVLDDEEGEDDWSTGVWGRPRTCRPRGGWRAPSWSWASVRTPVQFADGYQRAVEPPPPEKAACEVVEVRCEPVGVDPLGELREGGCWLVMRGRLIPTRVRFRQPGKSGSGGEQQQQQQQQQQQEKLKPWTVVSVDVLADWGYSANVTMDDDCQSLVTADGTLPTVYLLLIGRGRPGNAWFFLVLVRASEEELGDEYSEVKERVAEAGGHVYRRWGLVEVPAGPSILYPDKWVDILLEKGEDAVVTII